MWTAKILPEVSLQLPVTRTASLSTTAISRLTYNLRRTRVSAAPSALLAERHKSPRRDNWLLVFILQSAGAFDRARQLHFLYICSSCPTFAFAVKQSRGIAKYEHHASRTPSWYPPLFNKYSTGPRRDEPRVIAFHRKCKFFFPK